MCSCGQPVLPGYDECRTCAGVHWPRFIVTTWPARKLKKQGDPSDTDDHIGILDCQDQRFASWGSLERDELVDLERIAMELNQQDSPGDWVYDKVTIKRNARYEVPTTSR